MHIFLKFLYLTACYTEVKICYAIWQLTRLCVHLFGYRNKKN